MSDKRFYSVKVYLNLSNPFRAYTGTEALWSDKSMEFGVCAVDATDACEKAFAVGNRQSIATCEWDSAWDHDNERYFWPSDVRSVSVGDLVSVVDVDDDYMDYEFMSCESFGWQPAICNSRLANGRDAMKDLLREVNPEWYVAIFG
jgi:hypothetical protein